MMNVYLVLYVIANSEIGYHDCFLNEKDALKEAEKMNATEKGMYYDYIVKYKNLSELNG